MFGVTGFFQVCQFFDDLVGVLSSELIDVARTVVAESAFTPVASACSEVGNDTFG